jgi:hypothetical protein
MNHHLLIFVDKTIEKNYFVDNIKVSHLAAAERSYRGKEAKKDEIHSISHGERNLHSLTLNTYY